MGFCKLEILNLYAKKSPKKMVALGEGLHPTTVRLEGDGRPVSVRKLEVFAVYCRQMGQLGSG